MNNEEGRSQILLHELPLVILLTIFQWSDVGLLISMSQVNKTLRRLLMDDKQIWRKRLYERLRVRPTKYRTKHAHTEVVKRIPTFRCGVCKCMELEIRPFYEPLFQKTICRECAKKPEHRTISASIAKSLFFLNDDDLLELKCMNTINHHHQNAHPIRVFKWTSVERLCRFKLREMGLTWQERYEKRQQRSKNMKTKLAATRTARQAEFNQALMTSGLVGYESDRFYTVVNAFFTGRKEARHGGLRCSARGKAWTLEEIIQHIHQCHQMGLDGDDHVENDGTLFFDDMLILNRLNT